MSTTPQTTHIRKVGPALTFYPVHTDAQVGAEFVPAIIGHNVAAVRLLNEIEATLATLDAMRAQYRASVADSMDVTALECVLEKLHRVEDAWQRAMWMADRERDMQREREERDAQPDPRFVGSEIPF